MKEPRGTWYKKNGYYYVRITYYEEGKRKTKNYPTGIRVDEKKEKSLKKKVEKKVAEILASFTVPELNQPAEIRCRLFADLIREWLELQCGSKAESTYAGYMYAANDVILYFTEICPVRTTELTSSMIERYQNWERARRQPGYDGKYPKKSKYRDGSGIENTIKHRTTLIRSVLQYAKREGIVDRNVASSRDCHISLPSPQRNVFPVLNLQESNRLMQLLDGEELWLKTAVAMGLFWGLRRSEVIGMREYAIDWATNRVTINHTVTQQTTDRKNTVTAKPVTKNKKVRALLMIAPINELVKALVEEHRRNEILYGESYDHTWDGYLIRYADGKLVSPNALTGAFDRFIKKHNVKQLRFHDLRHSCASNLYAMGVDLITIQEILGHAHLSTTRMYTHITDDRQDAALARMSSHLMGESESRKEK